MKTWSMVLALVLTGWVAATAADVPIVDEEPGEFKAKDLSFESRVEVEATCKEAFKTLTEFGRLQKLVPHLHGKAKVAAAKDPGDTLSYEFERTDGTKNTGRMILTTLETDHRVQILVQPDEGPWLRVQEFKLYAPAGGEKKSSSCHIAYEETYNPKPLRNAAYDMKEIIEQVRAPYMEIILRRLKNISEGEEAGPKAETEKLREIAKHFP
ncbi:MAG: hypothetical protein ACREQY_08230 [Candidatus Binatia bacterium]